MTNRSGATASQAPEAAPASWTSLRLFRRARAGHPSAVSSLFRRHAGRLRMWARGRLPARARALLDTADLVQDAILQTLRRFDQFEPRGRDALQAYLRRAVQNRIRDELRRIGTVPMVPIESDIGTAALSPLEEAERTQAIAKYKAALSRLPAQDQMLIVGRLELEYDYEQLALVCGRRTPDAARVATKRALLRLTEELTRAAPHPR